MAAQKRAAISIMPYWSYILRSQSSGRYYCGSTSDLERRVRQHNDPQYRLSKTTKHFPGPWEVVFSEKFETRSAAMTMEKHIKKRGIRRFLQERIQDDSAQAVESRGARD